MQGVYYRYEVLHCVLGFKQNNKIQIISKYLKVYRNLKTDTPSLTQCDLFN